MIIRKSITVGLMVAVMAFFTACQEDPPALVEATLSINTAAMYDALGISHEVATQIVSKDYALVDSLLIYDDQGGLVARMGAEIDVLGQVSISAPVLEDGAYTFVVIQTCRNAEGEFQWDVLNAYSLSSLLVKQTDTRMGSIGALGFCCETVTTQKGALQLSITPEVAGSIVEGRIVGYVKRPWDIIDRDLRPVMLYGENVLVGVYPGRRDDTQWIFSSRQREEIGRLNEGTSRCNYFMLSNGNNVVFTLEQDGFSYCKDTLNLSPGGNYVCYYNFASETFFNSYFGTPEELEVFQNEQSGKSCALYPCLRWGASKEEVDQYVKGRAYFPCEHAERSVTGTEFTQVRYEIMPGFFEDYFFSSTDTNGLFQVGFRYKGTVSREKVERGMMSLGYQYIGAWMGNISLDNFYLSPDGQTECLTMYSSDTSKAYGDYAWDVVFQPFNPEHLTHLEM